MMLVDHIPADWRDVLAGAISAPSFLRLTANIADERARSDTAIYPPEADVFNALRLTPFDSVRAVILGQDPYHGVGQAHGLAFSVPAEIKWPPSLCNILEEWGSDLTLEPPSIGTLERWARNGVLLLNTVLTVRRGVANSHRYMGWQDLTDAIISAVATRPDPVVFILWGRQAQPKRCLIAEPHVVVESNHPSPLSARREPTPFLGSKPFSAANAKLALLGRPSIDWTLSAPR